MTRLESLLLEARAWVDSMGFREAMLSDAEVAIALEHARNLELALLYRWTHDLAGRAQDLARRAEAAGHVVLAAQARQLAELLVVGPPAAP